MNRPIKVCALCALTMGLCAAANGDKKDYGWSLIVDTDDSEGATVKADQSDGTFLGIGNGSPDLETKTDSGNAERTRTWEWDGGEDNKPVEPKTITPKVAFTDVITISLSVDGGAAPTNYANISGSGTLEASSDLGGAPFIELPSQKVFTIESEEVGAKQLNQQYVYVYRGSSEWKGFASGTVSGKMTGNVDEVTDLEGEVEGTGSLEASETGSSSGGGLAISGYEVEGIMRINKVYTHEMAEVKKTDLDTEDNETYTCSLEFNSDYTANVSADYTQLNRKATSIANLSSERITLTNTLP